MHARLITSIITVSAVAVALTACSSGPGASTGDIAPVAPSGDAAECQAEEVGPITRCTNFFDDAWPTIQANMDKLYEEAKATDGGRLVVWDWYELSPDVIAAFTKAYPGITVETRGLTYNLSSAIVSAKATGQRNSDIVSGSITTTADMYDQGYWEKVDWTEYGVPKEFFTIGAPEMLPDGLNGTLLQYNTDKVDSVPDSLDGLKDPSFNNQVVVASYNAGTFSGYGKRFGEDKMVSLIKDLTGSGNLSIVEDVGSLVSNGDKAVAISGMLYNPNPVINVAAFEADNVYVQFSGINSDAKNKAAAALWILWNAYDPEWLQTRATDEMFSTSATPFPGLPEKVFTEQVGLAAVNSKPYLEALSSGQAEVETQETRDEWLALIKAADVALNND